MRKRLRYVIECRFLARKQLNFAVWIVRNKKKYGGKRVAVRMIRRDILAATQAPDPWSPQGDLAHAAGIVGPSGLDLDIAYGNIVSERGRFRFVRMTARTIRIAESFINYFYTSTPEIINDVAPERDTEEVVESAVEVLADA